MKQRGDGRALKEKAATMEGTAHEKRQRSEPVASMFFLVFEEGGASLGRAFRYCRLGRLLTPLFYFVNLLPYSRSCLRISLVVIRRA